MGSGGEAGGHEARGMGRGGMMLGGIKARWRGIAGNADSGARKQSKMGEG